MHKIQEKCVILLATGFCAGYVPIAPGTFGAVAAIPLSYLVSKIVPIQGVLLVCLIVGCSVPIAGKAEELFGTKDSGYIVIDEIAGFLVTMLLIPWSGTSVAAGFLIFRLLDITKPFPIKMLEARLPGGWGVVGDDVLAGVYANVVLRIIIGVLSFE